MAYELMYLGCNDQMEPVHEERWVMKMQPEHVPAGTVVLLGVDRGLPCPESEWFEAVVTGHSNGHDVRSKLIEYTCANNENGTMNIDHVKKIVKRGEGSCKPSPDQADTRVNDAYLGDLRELSPAKRKTEYIGYRQTAIIAFVLANVPKFAATQTDPWRFEQPWQIAKALKGLFTEHYSRELGGYYTVNKKKLVQAIERHLPRAHVPFDHIEEQERAMWNKISDHARNFCDEP